jgi:hypothetical protein
MGYQLTLKGIIGQDLWDEVELYGYRTATNGILLEGGGQFVKVHFKTTKQKKAKKVFGRTKRH